LPFVTPTLHNLLRKIKIVNVVEFSTKNFLGKTKYTGEILEFYSSKLEIWNKPLPIPDNVRRG